MSPEYQYKVWAHRIKRQFQKDCRLPADWDCECLKCEAALAEEINNYHLIQCNLLILIYVALLMESVKISEEDQKQLQRVVISCGWKTNNNYTGLHFVAVEKQKHTVVITKGL